MKAIGSFVGLLVFSLASLAADYAGEGSWKSTNGDAGSYEVEATIEQGDENTVTIDQKLFFDNEALEISFVLRKTDDTFFDVLDNQGQVVGSGYCWETDDENEEFVCHSSSTHAGYVVESTIKHTADAIYRIGSKTPIEGGDVVTWKDVLVLQSDE